MPTWFDNSWTFTKTDIVEWERELTTGNYNLKYLQPPKRFNCKGAEQ